jgi:hypothetical protein
MNTTQPTIIQDEVDLVETESFLRFLDPKATEFCFQVFDDHPDEIFSEEKNKWVKTQRFPPTHVTGPLKDLAPWLMEMNQKGAGVFVTVNETDGQGRSIPNIKHIRAVFRELDKPVGPNEEIWLEPSIIVESSPGKRHEYFLCDPEDPLSPDEFEGVEDFLIYAAGSDLRVGPESSSI